LRSIARRRPTETESYMSQYEYGNINVSRRESLTFYTADFKQITLNTTQRYYLKCKSELKYRRCKSQNIYRETSFTADGQYEILSQ
jgi:hypothetical protein